MSDACSECHRDILDCECYREPDFEDWENRFYRELELKKKKYRHRYIHGGHDRKSAE